MAKETNNWRYEEHFHRIPMSDDYDGHYEITNGDISLCTGDDPEDITETENTLQKVANALNESGCKFYVNTAAEHALHIENMLLRGVLEDILQLETHDDIIEAVTEALKSLKQSNAGRPTDPCPHCGKELFRDRNLCCRECGKEVERPEYNVSIGEHITYCHECGFPVDECNCIDK